LNRETATTRPRDADACDTLLVLDVLDVLDLLDVPGAPDVMEA